MANPEHLEILEKGVDIWNKWRENNGIRPDFSLTDLRNADLRNADLRGVNLSESNLRGINLIKANLRGANLSKANLIEAKVIKANLRGANLRRAKLIKANLRRANLRGAKLIEADLNKAKLSKAKLSEVDFSEAYFRGVDLSEANFSRAKLSNAELNKTIFYSTNLGNTDLTGILNLESCKHYGPSYLDRQTIINSGELPIEFLRGCGLSDWEIEFTKLYNSDLGHNQVNDVLYKIYDLRFDKLIQFYSCFISYNHKDRAFARRLHDELQEKGIRCWLDAHQMLPGDDIYEQVDRGIRLWDKVLLCCSEDSLTSWWVDNEIDTAFEKERKFMKERSKKILALIPLNLDGYMFTSHWKNGKKRQVLSRLAADFTGWESNNKFDKEFDKVIRALQVNGKGRKKPPKSLL